MKVMSSDEINNTIDYIINFFEKLKSSGLCDNIRATNRQDNIYVDKKGYVHIRNFLQLEVSYDNVYLKKLENDKDGGSRNE